MRTARRDLTQAALLAVRRIPTAQVRLASKRKHEAVKLGLKLDQENDSVNKLNIRSGNRHLYGQDPSPVSGTGLGSEVECTEWLLLGTPQLHIVERKN